ncbi:MAG TPA: DUF4132 domain-containing protein [Urbifossiella sp.]|nr:DUF4132 domain-containing protein [Urbifossiella sp.]
MARKSKPAADGLLGAFADGLAKHLGLIGADDPAAADAAVRYVRTGEPADLPLTLGKAAKAGERLFLAGVSTQAAWDNNRRVNEARAKLFALGKDLSPELWQRFAEVLDAAARASGRKLTPPAGWPGWLYGLVVELLHTHYQGGQQPGGVWPVATLAAVCAEGGVSVADAVRVGIEPTFQESLRGTGVWYYGNTEAPFGEWAEFLNARPAVVREVLTALPGPKCVQAVGALGRVGFDFAPVLDMVADLATGSSKTVREALLPYLIRFAAAAYPHVEKHLAGDASRRNEAAAVLWRLDAKAAEPRLRAHLETESAERVKQTIEKLLAVPDDAAPDAGGFDLPPVTIELREAMLPGAARDRVRAFFDKALQAETLEFERQLAMWNGPERPKWMTKPTKPVPLSTGELELLFSFVEGRSGARIDPAKYGRPYTWNLPVGDDSFAPPDVHLVHVVRLAYALGQLNTENHGRGVWWNQMADLENYRARCPEPFGLRELDAVVARLPKSSPGRAAVGYLSNNTTYHQFCDWEPAAVWPAFVDHLDLLRDTLTGVNTTGQRDYFEPTRRRNAFRVLGMFPHLPPGFINLLWDLALGEGKSERPLAQAALRTVPGKTDKVLVALADGRQGVRAAAAEWLGDIGDTAAIDPLKASFRKEKQEAVKGVMMAALEKLGADVNEFLDRKALLKEAEAGLAKKPPAGMDWFPLDRLPAVRWQDTGKDVDPRVVRWWVVQAVQQKSPACGPVLRRFLGLCRPADTAALATFVLSSWIGHDTRTASAEESAAKAKKDAAAHWAQWKGSGHLHYFEEQYKDEEGYRAHLFRQYSNTLVGSASGEKGMLAVVSAAGDAGCVRVCEQYVRTWFGQRLAQCKALVEVLANLKHPTALQVLLSIANRFRTKAVRELAGQFVTAVAEREGWTVDELADRTIPDAGFTRPEGGGPAELTLNYGPRQFTAALNDELEPVVRGDGGKPLKALPAPGKADDAEKAKEAKKAFADAKKQLKEVVKLQGERLYEALCTQRTWAFNDWRRYLAEHPIVGRVCVRLAWVADDRLFRPLEDGSLTDETDAAVTVPADAVVRLAHAATVTPEQAAAWKQHFTDYDVTPPFDQFGREPFVLPDARKKEAALKDFEGHKLTTFQLRGRATKLGYVRGEAEDGGCFYTYRKPFPSLGLQAEVEFSGSGLPEEDRPVALHGLSFVRIKPANESGGRWNRTAVELGKVPPVLLSECYNDVRQLAAEGTGFDPEWQKVSYY